MLTLFLDKFNTAIFPSCLNIFMGSKKTILLFDKLIVLTEELFIFEMAWHNIFKAPRLLKLNATYSNSENEDLSNTIDIQT